MTDATKQKRYAYTRKWKAEHREQVKAYNQEWALKNRDARSKYMRQFRIENKKAIEIYQKQYRKDNLSTNRIKQRNYRKNKWRSDPNFKMKLYLGNRIRLLLSGKKNARTTELLGCSIENFWVYLESKFSEGMTRENHGRIWHVDHIMPCAIFDLTKVSHQKRCFHFSNLQPLFALANSRKRDKVLSNQFNLL